MKTKDAIELAGSAAELSRLLNITQSAVSQWKENVPELSLFRLMKKKPEWFQDGSDGPRYHATPPANHAQAATQTVAGGV